MSKVERIEAELKELSVAELHQIRDWLDDFVEDSLEFTPEFEAAVSQSEREMPASRRPRIRQSR